MGDHIRKRRYELDLLQKDIAQQIGVTLETMTNWENNHSYPKIKYWPKLIEFLGYDPEWKEGKDLSTALINYRRQHGLKRKFLAEKIGVDETTVLWWERGREVKVIRCKERLEDFLLEAKLHDVIIPYFDPSIAEKSKS